MVKKITEEVKKRVFKLHKEGRTQIDIASELCINRASVNFILNGDYNAKLRKRKTKAYKMSPFSILDIIAEEREVSMRGISDTIGYIPQTNKYYHLLNTLKQLTEDGILVRKGAGGIIDPFRYSLNPEHPQHYILNAMCNGRFKELSENLRRAQEKD